MAKRKVELKTYNFETGKFAVLDTKPKKEEVLKLDGAEVSLFDFLNDITSGKKGIINENNEHKFDPYMTCKFLSMDKSLIPLVNTYLNPFQGTMDKTRFYHLCMRIIPKGKRYLKFLKVDEQLKLQEENIKLICELYEVSKRQAYQYITIMSKTDITAMRLKFGIVDKPK